MQREYAQVKIGRLDGENRPNYEVLGLPPGSNFKDPEAYERHVASWLKINGVGFAASGAELGEHGEKITVRQDTEGGSLHIEV